jgi:hypothetical protein
VMTSQLASCDVYRCASLIYFRCFRTLNIDSGSGTMVCNKMFLTHIVFWTRLRVSFNACVDPLFEFQVIYRVLTRQSTTG